MTARSFEGADGATWEVFEVRRATLTPGAVSAGLEHGWLAFVSGDNKRRLAPIPPNWSNAPAVDLQRMWAMARVASGPRLTPTDSVRAIDPASRRSAPAYSPVTSAELSDDDSVSAVEDEVRRFARAARDAGQPAIDAMVALKARLQARFADDDSPARNLREVRRWFVESFYFQRDR